MPVTGGGTSRSGGGSSPRFGSTDSKLHVLGDGVAGRVGLWEGVVSGDVYVIQGQSNAVAASHLGPRGEESPFVRSFGSSTA